MRLILLGAPGSGKGTQAQKIQDNFNLVHISTGEIIRENLKNKTQTGLLAESIINKGDLLPDELVVEMVKDILSKQEVKDNFVLDGFPRTIKQAEALDKITQIDKVIFIDVNFDYTKDRILKRRTCPLCKKTYSDTLVCPNCNVTLIMRSDDNEETINSRFKVYEEQTKPLVNYYKQKNLLYKVDGSKTIEQVYKQIEFILNEGKVWFVNHKVI